jgi:hypothetical protein
MITQDASSKEVGTDYIRNGANDQVLHDPPIETSNRRKYEHESCRFR